MCPTCGKFFKQKCNLTRHLKIHTCDMSICPYACSLCEKAFRHLSSLAIHIRSHKSQVAVKSCANGAKYPYKNSSSKESIASTAANCKIEDMCLQTCSSAECLGLHSSEIPFVLNIKVEDDF